MSDAIEVRPVYEAPLPYDPNSQSWEQLNENADVIEGYSLLNNEACRKLMGVPMMLIRATYRDGIGEFSPASETITCLLKLWLRHRQ